MAGSPRSNRLTKFCWGTLCSAKVDTSEDMEPIEFGVIWEDTRVVAVGRRGFVKEKFLPLTVAQLFKPDAPYLAR